MTKTELKELTQEDLKKFVASEIAQLEVLILDEIEQERLIRDPNFSEDAYFKKRYYYLGNLKGYYCINNELLRQDFNMSQFKTDMRVMFDNVKRRLLSVNSDPELREVHFAGLGEYKVLKAILCKLNF